MQSVSGALKASAGTLARYTIWKLKAGSCHNSTTSIVCSRQLKQQYDNYIARVETQIAVVHHESAFWHLADINGTDNVRFRE